ncbi:hypothetical protein ABPG75_011504 [Micractinium tetrahymenae]
MPGKVIPCALCQAEAAVVFCVNDDAHLCTSCDASVHAANPLLARHERRPLTALACAAGECASAAHGSPASTDYADVAVVPQLGGTSPASAPVPEPQPEPQHAAPAAPLAPPPMPHWAEPAAPVPQQLADCAPGPLSLYEDSFFARSLTTSDLLDLDGDDLELPGSVAGSGFACFDPLDDCVVPSFGSADRFAPAAPAAYGQQSSFLKQPSYMPYMKPQVQQPTKLVPLGGMAAVPAAGPKPVAQLTDAEAEAARVQRHRERQRKKRAFGRTVRYQSRRAYAEIRPRIKGRFVTPEEYAAYQAQMAAAEQAAGGEAGDYAEAEGPEAPHAEAAVPSFAEEDAVVPVPTFVAA